MDVPPVVIERMYELAKQSGETTTTAEEALALAKETHG